MKKAKILVIDDDQTILNSLSRIFAYEGYAVDTAKDAEEGLARHASGRPDLVVLDVSLPGLSGLDICKRLKLRTPQVPVLFLSARDEVPDRVKGLESGADDYLVKPFAFEELLARISVLLRRRLGDPSERLEFDDVVLDDRTKQVTRGGRGISFSATEYQMLRCFLSAPEQVLSKEQILERVWGPGFHADLNIVEVYVRYLRTKLEEGGERRIIHTIRGAGYVLRACP